MLHGKYDRDCLKGTIAEFSAFLAKNVLDDSKAWVNYDFGIISPDNLESEDYDFIESSIEGWYGVKKIDTGFVSDCYILFSDYYGGGCASMCQVWDDGFEESEFMASDIQRMLLSTLTVVETGVTPDTIIYAEVCAD